jgi:ABC-type phosphate transport system substrate-binding protein
MLFILFKSYACLCAGIACAGISSLGMLTLFSYQIQAQQQNLSTILVDGSSTVFPISQVISQRFRQTPVGLKA